MSTMNARRCTHYAIRDMPDEKKIGGSELQKLNGYYKLKVRGSNKTELKRLRRLEVDDVSTNSEPKLRRAGL